jgi:hypothetical protein
MHMANESAVTASPINSAIRVSSPAVPPIFRYGRSMLAMSL